MREVKEKLEGLKSALPVMKDFGSLDQHALKIITQELEEAIALLYK